MKSCFIILHYMALQDTIDCISSLKKLYICGNDETRCVVVDNGSPNGTGKILERMYLDEEHIHIICNKHNKGFSSGNNIGCLYARATWDPDFVIVANNDILFTQEDFLVKIEDEYNKSQFAVMGSDIYNISREYHQSPLRCHPPDIKEVNRTILLNRLFLSTQFISYPVIRKWKNKEIMKTIDSKEYDKRQENVCLQGACLIFSRNYFGKRNTFFAPETFLYYEEFLVSLWCQYHDAKVVYNPDLKVLHKDSVATNISEKKIKRRLINNAQNILNAAKVYRKELLRYANIR